MAIFDLDNTLADPFQPISPAMASSLSRLIEHSSAAIMTAASLDRVKKDVLSALPANLPLEKLWLFTTNAGQAYAFKNNEWRPQYDFEFTEDQVAKMRAAIEQSIRETNALEGTKVYGDQFIDYKGYFAFTALGIGAPIEERRKWDPDFSKRSKLRTAVAEKLPEFDVYIGGSTSIDVTQKGINKSYGIDWLSKTLSIPASEMLYVGDALYESGNDYVVIQTGIQTRRTKNPDETLGIVEEVLAACGV